MKTINKSDLFAVDLFKDQTDWKIKDRKIEFPTPRNSTKGRDLDLKIQKVQDPEQKYRIVRTKMLFSDVIAIKIHS